MEFFNSLLVSAEIARLEDLYDANHR